MVAEDEDGVRETVEETLVGETKVAVDEETLVGEAKITVEVNGVVGVAIETAIEDVAGVGLARESVKIESVKETAEDKTEPVGFGWRVEEMVELTPCQIITVPVALNELLRTETPMAVGRAYSSPL